MCIIMVTFCSTYYNYVIEAEIYTKIKYVCDCIMLQHEFK